MACTRACLEHSSHSYTTSRDVFTKDDQMSDSTQTLLRRADSARRENRPADAHRDPLAAVSLCRNAGTRRELVRALKALGQIERDSGRGEAARSLYEEAVALCREEGDPLTLAHTVRHLGDIHRDAGRAKLAEPCYQEALALYRSNEQATKLDLANAIRPLAILKQDGGDAEAARRLWQEAKELYSAVNVPAGVTESSTRLAQLSR